MGGLMLDSDGMVMPEGEAPSEVGGVPNEGAGPGDGLNDVGGPMGGVNDVGGPMGGVKEVGGLMGGAATDVGGPGG